MCRRAPQIGMLVLLISIVAWSQTGRYTVPAASVGDEFSAYHRALDSAADLTLASVEREATQAANAPTNTTAPADAAVLHQFAEKYWNGNDEAVRRAVAGVTQLKPILTPILREEGVPDEVVALVLIESAGRATALSPKGARGIWQLMPDTARRYGLAVAADRDERFELLKSTRAAARYLRDLYQRFGDWRLAFAAYNAGGHAVERAVTRTGRGDFLRIDSALPEETRNYIPAVMNAMELLGSSSQEVVPAVKSGRSPARSVLYARQPRERNRWCGTKRQSQ